MTATVEVLGIRHHGPGSARSVAAGPRRAAPGRRAHRGRPRARRASSPLAGRPRPGAAGRRARVRRRRARGRRVLPVRRVLAGVGGAALGARPTASPVRFADLPAAHLLADADAPTPDGGPTSPAPAQARPRPTPSATLARRPATTTPSAGGRTRSSTAHVVASSASRAGQRARWPGGPRERAARRRRRRPTRRERPARGGHAPGPARRDRRTGDERVAVVCGAYHAPALDPAMRSRRRPATTRCSRGCPRSKVAATWAPWTVGPAGVRERLRRRGDRRRAGTSTCSTTGAASRTTMRSSWLVARRAARCAAEQLDASPASVVEATRLADDPGRGAGPAVGRALRARRRHAEAVLCDGSRRAAAPRRPTRWSSATGSARSRSATPMVPARRGPRAPAAGAAAQARRDVADHRASTCAGSASEPARCCCTGCGCSASTGAPRPTRAARRARSRRPGSSSGAPSSRWRVIEAGLLRHDRRRRRGGHGRRHGAADAADLATLAGSSSSACSPTCPRGCASVVAALAERTARQHDVLALLGAVEPLARTLPVRRRPRRRRRRRRARARGRGRPRPRSACRAACVGARRRRPPRRCATASRRAHRGVALLDDEALREPLAGARSRPSRRDDRRARLGGRPRRTGCCSTPARIDHGRRPPAG